MAKLAASSNSCKNFHRNPPSSTTKMKPFEEVLKTRQIVLFQRISMEVVQELISSIRSLSLSGATDAELLINSCGGSLASALNLYDAIIASGVNFKGVVVAECLSAAVTVLQACKTRHAFPNASFLVHETSRELKMTMTRSKTLESYLNNVEEVYNAVISMDGRNEHVLRSRLNADHALFDKHYESDSHFYPEDALEMGLIDEIVAINPQSNR